MFNNVLIPMSAFAHSDYMINSCLNRLVVSIRYWNACPKRCWFSENYTTSSNNMSNIAHMSGSIVLTGYRSTAHELMVASWGRIMSPQLPAWEWRSPSICIPVEGIDQMISLQAAMPNGWGLFSFLSLDSARGTDTTYIGGKQNDTLLFWSVQQILCIFIGGRM